MMLIKAKMLAVGFMVAGGIAAPIITHYATTPNERAIPAKAELAPEAPVINLVEPPAPAPEVIMEAMAVTPQPRAQTRPAIAPPPAELEKERTCQRRALHTLGEGAVVICDVERTPNHKAVGSLFAPVDKPTTLTPRDLPSPSGLLR